MQRVIRESCNFRVIVIVNFDLGKVVVLKFGSATRCVLLMLLEADLIVRVLAVLVSIHRMAVVGLQVLASLATTALSIQTITVLLLMLVP